MDNTLFICDLLLCVGIVGLACTGIGVLSINHPYSIQFKKEKADYKNQVQLTNGIGLKIVSC